MPKFTAGYVKSDRSIVSLMHIFVFAFQFKSLQLNSNKTQPAVCYVKNQSVKSNVSISHWISNLTFCYCKFTDTFVKWNGENSFSHIATMNYLARAFESTTKAFLGGQSVFLSKKVENRSKFHFYPLFLLTFYWRDFQTKFVEKRWKQNHIQEIHRERRIPNVEA